MTTTLKLYEIAATHRSIFDAIEANDGELTPELEAALEASSSCLSEKVDACCVRISELDIEESEAQGLIIGIQAQLDRAKARRDSIVREMKNLESYVQRNLEVAGEPRIDTGRFNVRIQANPLSAQWTGPADAIPEAFQRVKTTVEFDKSMAVAAHKAGVALPDGVEIRQSKRLVIK